jgi:hypothetical protein
MHPTESAKGWLKSHPKRSQGASEPPNVPVTSHCSHLRRFLSGLLIEALILLAVILLTPDRAEAPTIPLLVKPTCEQRLRALMGPAFAMMAGSELEWILLRRGKSIDEMRRGFDSADIVCVTNVQDEVWLKSLLAGPGQYVGLAPSGTRAQVIFDPRKNFILIFPTFFQSSRENQQADLIHECLHLLLHASDLSIFLAFKNNGLEHRRQGTLEISFWAMNKTYERHWRASGGRTPP